MKNHLFSVFLSYSIGDKLTAVQITNELRRNNIEVINFIDSEPLGADIEEWIAENIADVDCVLVLLTSNCLENPTWIEREVGLAIKFLSSNKFSFSNIIPICSNISVSELSQPFQPRDYISGLPYGLPIFWSRVNCLMLDRDGLSSCITNFVENLKPQITQIKDPDLYYQSQLFESAMDLYKTLLPDERVRDTYTNIKEWLHRSWDVEGNPVDHEKFLHFFYVQHIKNKAIALIWCSVDIQTGFAFMNFWGTRTGHRSQGRSLIFASDILNKIIDSGIKFNNIFFCCEPVNWLFLNKIIKFNKKNIKNRHELINDEEIFKLLLELPKNKKDRVLDEMRKFRRFAFYSSGIGLSRYFPGKRVEINYYVESFESSNDFSEFKMANFIQPPCSEPFSIDACSQLWLFNISINSSSPTPQEAVNWIYHDFFSYTMKNNMNSFNSYDTFIDQQKETISADFLANAKTQNAKPREVFKPYLRVLNIIKSHMLQEQKLGNHFDRWDIQL